ncbi:hypothetical protein WKK05_04525 [Nostoc sp. UHCC 0302]
MGEYLAGANMQNMLVAYRDRTFNTIHQKSKSRQGRSSTFGYF